MSFNDWTLAGAARGVAKGWGGAKMNFPILTYTKVWDIKCSVLNNSVDSESVQILKIGLPSPPPGGQLGEGQGARQKLTSLF